MNNRRLKFNANIVDFGARVDLFMGYREEGQFFVGTPIEFKPRGADTYIDDPSMAISYDDAVALLDALIAAGVKPSDQGSTGQLNAVKAHLEDMRTLVFKGS